jgi:hypothetical protein
LLAHEELVKVNEQQSVATIVNLCPDLPLPRANRWTQSS